MGVLKAVPPQGVHEARGGLPGRRSVPVTPHYTLILNIKYVCEQIW